MEDEEKEEKVVEDALSSEDIQQEEIDPEKERKAKRSNIFFFSFLGFMALLILTGIIIVICLVTNPGSFSSGKCTCSECTGKYAITYEVPIR